MRFKLIRFYTLSTSDNKTCQICNETIGPIYLFALELDRMPPPIAEGFSYNSSIYAHRACMSQQLILPSEEFLEHLNFETRLGYK